MKPVEELTYQEKLQIALKLKDTAAFFATYFSYLSKFETQKACFLYLNEIHEEIYGVEKYSSYGTFRQVMYRDGKKYLKRKTK